MMVVVVAIATLQRANGFVEEEEERKAKEHM